MIAEVTLNSAGFDTDVFTPLWAQDHLAGAGVCLQAKSGDSFSGCSNGMCFYIEKGCFKETSIKRENKISAAEALLDQNPRDEVQDHC